MRVRVIHISIDVELFEDSILSAESPLDIYREEFSEMMRQASAELDARDYIPMLSEKLMEVKYKSNYAGSRSYQYVYFKLDDDFKVKVVLDVRISDHRLRSITYKSGKLKMTGEENKKEWLKSEGQYKFVDEADMDLAEDAEDPEFINIWLDYKESNNVPLSIFIDSTECFSFNDATSVLIRRIDKLP